jgi:YaiO family outer membrane protein
MMRSRAGWTALLLASVVAHSSARAQPPRPPSRATVEIGYGESRLTAGYGQWQDVSARALFASGADVWRVEASHRRAFGDSGLYVGTGVTHTIDRSWYGSLGVGTSAGGFFFPRVYAGAALGRKWLARRQLVTTSALSYYGQKDAHRDLLWTGSVIYYFSRPAVVETGVIVGRSSPGAIMSQTPFVAATVGRPRERTFTARLAAGREAYQRIGADRALVAFSSQALSLGWREVIAADAGIFVQLDHYRNPVYRRTGLFAGVFLGTALFDRTPRDSARKQ